MIRDIIFLLLAVLVGALSLVFFLVAVGLEYQRRHPIDKDKG